MTTISEQSNNFNGLAKVTIKLIKSYGVYGVSYNAVESHDFTVYKTLAGAQKKYNRLVSSMVIK